MFMGAKGGPPPSNYCMAQLCNPAHACFVASEALLMRKYSQTLVHSYAWAAAARHAPPYWGIRRTSQGLLRIHVAGVTWVTGAAHVAEDAWVTAVMQVVCVARVSGVEMNIAAVASVLHAAGMFPPHAQQIYPLKKMLWVDVAHFAAAEPLRNTGVAPHNVACLPCATPHKHKPLTAALAALWS
jgi:hypothetical protein